MSLLFATKEKTMCLIAFHEITKTHGVMFKEILDSPEGYTHFAGIGDLEILGMLYYHASGKTDGDVFDCVQDYATEKYKTIPRESHELTTGIRTILNAILRDKDNELTTISIIQVGSGVPILLLNMDGFLDPIWFASNIDISLLNIEHRSSPTINSLINSLVLSCVNAYSMFDLLILDSVIPGLTGVESITASDHLLKIVQLTNKLQINN